LSDDRNRQQEQRSKAQSASLAHLQYLLRDSGGIISDYPGQQIDAG
jgi:hypothetical protein